MRIDVSDTGTGMDAETRSRCFEPFFTTNPRQLSTGLGLPSARASVLRYGGDLSLAPDGGQGTTFRLELPLHGSGDDAVSSKHHLTLIELRDPRHRALTRLLLAKRGIDEWKGGIATPEHHPDVVICDAEGVSKVLSDRHDWNAETETRVIAIGSREGQTTGNDVVWILPTNLSALSEALD